jgi:hypothetical protein
LSINCYPTKEKQKVIKAYPYHKPKTKTKKSQGTSGREPPPKVLQYKQNTINKMAILNPSLSKITLRQVNSSSNRKT